MGHYRFYELNPSDHIMAGYSVGRLARGFRLLLPLRGAFHRAISATAAAPVTTVPLDADFGVAWASPRSRIRPVPDSGNMHRIDTDDAQR